MNKNYPYESPEPEHDRFFQKVKIPYDRSREEAWETLEQKMDEAQPAKMVRMFPHRAALAVAAILVLLLGSLLVMRYYSSSITTQPGELLPYRLPDGSRVELNAGSELKYYPLWWKVKRLVELNGEGYFEVEKGKGFIVTSLNGTTQVLGTTFNIYSRPDGYRVSCFSGSVRVTSRTGQEAVLSPEYEAVIEPGGDIMVSKENVKDHARSWVDGMLRFSARPLRLVFDELERQYGITILFRSDSDHSFTGYFSRGKPVEEVIGLVCKPFGLTFARASETTYQVYPK